MINIFIFLQIVAYLGNIQFFFIKKHVFILYIYIFFSYYVLLNCACAKCV